MLSDGEDDDRALAAVPSRPGASRPRALRLRGGGGDGGVYPLTHAEMQWMTQANVGRGGRDGGNKAWTHQWADKASEDAMRLDRATLCAVSFKALETPVCVTDLGLLCNKEELLERLLTKSMPSHLEHVASLRDFAEATLHANPNYNPEEGIKGGGAAEDAEVPFYCPVANLPLNGRFPFLFLRSSGHVVSERAFKSVGAKSCPVTEVAVAEEDVVPLNPKEEVREDLEKRQEARRAAASAAAKEKKKKKKEGKEAAASGPAASASAASTSASASAAGGASSSAEPPAGTDGVGTDGVGPSDLRPPLPRGESVAPAAPAAGAARPGKGKGAAAGGWAAAGAGAGGAGKREREWETAIRAKGEASSIYKSLFMTAEDKKREAEADAKNFAGRGIPMSLSRSTKFTFQK